MSEVVKILLGKNKRLGGRNEDNFLDFPLESYEKNLPVADTTVELNAYERYFQEKDASDKYRLAFTVTPVCTNVLFNIVTETVYKEGDDGCVVFGMNGPISGKTVEKPFKDYMAYKGMDTPYAIDSVSRKLLIRDTGFSHKSIGPVVYHCGYDIFNNHILRRKNFFVVNKMDGSEHPRDRVKFNTLTDFMRDRDGEVVTQKIPKIVNGKLSTESTRLHLNQFDDVYSYVDSVERNLIERNGWVGFLNTTFLPVVNYITSGGEEVVLNKCMNNNKAWEQIDMYPDRTLYWFTPKLNKYRGRFENNWNYKITYPASSSKDYPFVTEKMTGTNGLSCKIVSKIDATLITEDETLPVTFRTGVRNNIREGDLVTLTFVLSDWTTVKTRPVRVVANGADEEREFSVRLYEIVNELATTTDNGKTLTLRRYNDIRVCRNVAGRDCEYYVRMFRPLGDYRSTLNKLAFAQTIYSDPVAQILFNDDVMVGDTRDNLGRPLTELYLTIVKNNKGYKDWYENNRFADHGDETVEFSHCFGEVTSGFDFPVDVECSEYNVHRIHSVPDTYCVSSGRVTRSVTKLETGITIDNEEFAGDIVEFSPHSVMETVLEDVYHRFNTAQRETTNPEYSGFTYEEILYDDYDVASRQSYTVDNTRTLSKKNLNIIPEGYYYKPHYRIQIREFDSVVQQGYHKKIGFTPVGSGTRNQWKIIADANYYFNPRKEVEEIVNGEVVKIIIPGDTMYLYHEGTEYIGEVMNVNREGQYALREVTIQFEDNVNLNWKNIRLYKKNPDMPDTAYDLEDGTGRYLWRELLSSAEVPTTSDLYDSYFTNGAHYFHKNINFYLKRQDPEGVYGIGNEPADLVEMFIINNKEKDVSYAEYVEEEGGNTLC